MQGESLVLSEEGSISSEGDCGSVCIVEWVGWGEGIYLKLTFLDALFVIGCEWLFYRWAVDSCLGGWSLLD